MKHFLQSQTDKKFHRYNSSEKKTMKPLVKSQLRLMYNKSIDGAMKQV